jgi:hypothetical protein
MWEGLHGQLDGPNSPLFGGTKGVLPSGLGYPTGRSVDGNVCEGGSVFRVVGEAELRTSVHEG